MWDVIWDVTLIAIAIFPFVMYAKAVWTSLTTPHMQRKITKQNILYVIAHPDDEAMFFVPSIVNLRQHNDLYLLCMSNGDADGLGKIREKELQKSGKFLKFQDVQVIDDPELKDGKQQYWSPTKIAEHISKYLKNKQGELEINFIITFDEHGVSNHPNHTAVFKGVKEVFENEEFQFDVMTLTTVNIIRKYLFYADMSFTTFDQLHYFLLQPYTCFKAMAIHHSQFVWFRKLFTIFSRYAYTNSFEHYSPNPEKYNRKK